MDERALAIAAPFTANEENFSPAAYWDENGYAVGYGNHYYSDGSAVSKGDTISKGEADQLLVDVLSDQIRIIESQLIRPVSSGLLAALADLRYNCGTITMDLLNLINSGASIDQIKSQYLNTCPTTGGIFSQALADRRARAWELVGGSFPWILVGVVITGAWLFYSSSKN